jgi:tetratricopeptide (TPR) repeat protein
MLNKLQPRQKREAGVTANVLLSLIDRMKGDASPLPRRYSQMKASAYNVHGRLAFAEGTEEGARRAVVHFEKYLKVCKAIGNDDGIAAAKGNIALAKSKYEGGNNIEEVLKASQELYELRVAEYGEESGYTIRAGNDYAIALRQANRWEEARELLTKLLATSKQVFGLHHNITKEIESVL